jgi:positive regulator of sigma E activity
MNALGVDSGRLTMRTRDGSPVPDVGTRVWVAVAERAILRAAMGLFGLPLVGMVAGSATASALAMTEPAVAGMAGAGLAAGWVVGAFALRRGDSTGAMLHDGYAERGVTLLNQAASLRSEARAGSFNMGKSRIT